jgi:hypothetical protein
MTGGRWLESSAHSSSPGDAERYVESSRRNAERYLEFSDRQLAMVPPKGSEPALLCEQRILTLLFKVSCARRDSDGHSHSLRARRANQKLQPAVIFDG